MLQNFLISLIACGSLFIDDLVTRTKHKWLTYLWLFIIIFIFKTILYSSLNGL